MFAFDVVEPQHGGHRVQHLPRRCRSPLLDTGVVIGAHPGRYGHLIATQAGHPTSALWAEPYVGRLDASTPGPEKAT